MSNKYKLLSAPLIILMSALSSGCMTGIVSRPDLKQLAYDENGVLRYEGKKVEGIKLELPWYQEMWPDSPSEWGFTLLTAGAAAAVSGGGGGGGGSDEAAEEPVTVTTSSSSSSSSSRSEPTDNTTTTTADTGGGGGGGGGGGSAPPSGGGVELPF